MGKTYSTLKVEKETKKKLKKLKNLREFELECEITISELLEEIMEEEFRKYDNLQIRKLK